MRKGWRTKSPKANRSIIFFQSSHQKKKKKFCIFVYRIMGMLQVFKKHGILWIGKHHDDRALFLPLIKFLVFNKFMETTEVLFLHSVCLVFFSGFQHRHEQEVSLYIIVLVPGPRKIWRCWRKGEDGFHRCLEVDQYGPVASSPPGFLHNYQAGWIIVETSVLCFRLCLPIKERRMLWHSESEYGLMKTMNMRNTMLLTFSEILKWWGVF